MADAFKKRRTQALSKFTRAFNELIQHIDNSAPAILTTPQFQKVEACWEKLEDAQDEFIENTDIDIDTDPQGIKYLDEPGQRHALGLKRYAEYLKQEKAVQTKHLEETAAQQKVVEEERLKTEAREQKAAEDQLKAEELGAKFESAKAGFLTKVVTFGGVNKDIQGTLEVASDTDKRKEWNKMESDFKALQTELHELAALDPSKDIDDVKATFDTEARDLFIDTQKWILDKLKDCKITSGGEKSLTPSATAHSTTRRETINLPHFKGDESYSPYLEYPSWRKRWDLQIVDYEEKSWSGLLVDHLDATAKSKFVGWGDDYEYAMKKLQSFYGDCTKVVKCVIGEITSQSLIFEGDYFSLISYSSTLENNYNRLLNLNKGLEHEMSNSSAMSMIVQKLPRTVREKWEEHLIGQAEGVRLKPFSEFITWLAQRKSIWERMASVELSATDDSNCFFGTPGGEKTCFGCGEKGHVKRSCPRNQSKTPKTRKPRDPPKVKKFWCALHRSDPNRSCFSNCCQELRRLDPKERLKLMKENSDCIHCCGDHKTDDCINKDRVCGGGKSNRGCSKNHKVHELFCLEAKVFSLQIVLSSNAQSKSETVVLLIMTVRTLKMNLTASVFWDGGCTANFIRDEFAKRCGFHGKEETLCVTTLGGVITDYKTVIAYKCFLLDVNGYIHYFEAYGMSSITGSVSKLKYSKLKQLFPHSSDKLLHSLERGSTVDVLIGLGQASWHPEKAEPAKGGGDLWIYRGLFGSCVGGRHPNISEQTTRNQELFHVNHVYHAISSPKEYVSHELEFCAQRVPKRLFENNTQDMVIQQQQPARSVNNISHTSSFVNDSNSNLTVSNSLFVSDESAQMNNYTSLADALPVAIPAVAEGFIEDVRYSKSVTCGAILTSPFGSEDLFFKADSLGTVVEPHCGGCKCGKCPVPGSLYSFRETQEKSVIENNLFRKEGENRWYTELPWVKGRDQLPKNDKAAYKNLLSTEKAMKRDPEKAAQICNQIDEMLERGAAIILSEEDVRSWKGPYHYLPMVLVKGKRFRICFDASRDQCGYPAMNKHLLKGPDRFVNNIASVILGFRNGRAAAVADLSKFHNQVYLVEDDIHMQRFLWRGLNTDIPPQVMAVRVNNFGVTSANCIATCALYKSADAFSEKYPLESAEIKSSTYVDDELVAAPDMSALRVKTSRFDEITNHAGMKNKGWLYSGDSSSSDIAIGEEAGIASEKVLGLLYNPSSDTFNFNVVLRFKVNSKEIEVTTLDQLMQVLSELVLSRRMLTSNIARIFDPIGFLCAILLQAKLLMREMWSEKDIGWDDPISDELSQKWIKFLSLLLKLSNIKFPRSLWPDGEVEGLPMLIVFSDGSALAFGAVAYIRWKLAGGGYWTRIIMAKCKISPKNMLSIPRMELNGAVLGNRIKNFILKETNFTFSKVYNFVDSSTVLGYLQKEYGSFNPYEGIRIAEVQSTNEFEGNALKGFAWVSGKVNPADWCTKPRSVEDLVAGGFYEAGPEFLREEEDCWPIKLTYKKDNFEGMIIVMRPIYCNFAEIVMTDYITRLVIRSSSWKRMIRVLAWMLRGLIFLTYKLKYSSAVLSRSELARSKRMLLKHAQKEVAQELSNAVDNKKGKFRRLSPSLDSDGVWRVGSRMRHHVPFTSDNQLPVILPNDHKITLLIMREAHMVSHPGQDGTLSRFRAQGFWTTRGGQLAKNVKYNCIPCRKTDHKTMTQPMGEFPEDLLKFTSAWGYCQLDLCGPYEVRGDINPKIRKKMWVMLIEDVNSGAVYLDVVDDYSAHAVIMTLSRFGNIRGWPGVISSDPGSQLQSASGKLTNWWNEMRDPLCEFSNSNSFEWKVSPADSPWRQGKAERRIGIVKKLIIHSVGDSTLTPLELQTALFNIANICNERPLGLSKPREDGSYTLITPNQLLMGRSLNSFPDDSGLAQSLPMKARFRLVNHVTNMFWQRWCSYVSPSLVIRQKWHEKSRNLCVGDLVMICEDSKVKSKYRMGVVDVVKESDDGFVRSATVRYCNIQSNPRGEDVVTNIHVTRSIQRLVLIMPVEEMSSSVVVKDYEHCVQCVVQV